MKEGFQFQISTDELSLSYYVIVNTDITNKQFWEYTELSAYMFSSMPYLLEENQLHSCVWY